MAKTSMKIKQQRPAKFSSQVILPLVRSYGDISTVTLSPGKMRIKFIRNLPEITAKIT